MRLIIEHDGKRYLVTKGGMSDLETLFTVAGPSDKQFGEFIRGLFIGLRHWEKPKELQLMTWEVQPDGIKEHIQR